jgi:hypothetical protein
VFIELIDSLRCPEPHEDTWLVGAFDRMAGRHVVDGRLACPVCKAEYPIRHRVAYFGVDPDESAEPPSAETTAPDEAERAMRTAAFLDLSSPGGFAVLAGSWADDAIALGEITEVRSLAVNPTMAIGKHEGTSVLRTQRRFPLAAGSMRGIALDRETSNESFVDSAVHALRAGGRLIAPVRVPVPPEIRELARDDEIWVGVREAAVSRPVKLGKSRSG